MIYFFYGDQPTMIKKQIKNVVKSVLINPDDLNCRRFDASETTVQEVVDEANYLPLGYDKKVVILENCYFLLKSKGRNRIESEQRYDELLNYLKAPSDYTEFILTANSLEIDEKSEITKLLKQKASVMVAKFPEKEDFNRYIKEYIEKRLHAKIDRDAIMELASRCDKDVASMQVNADKLATYTDHITYDDVCLLVSKPLEENSFQLYNHLINNKKVDALSLYRDLRSQNVEPVTLISQLANQFRLLNMVSYLTKNGKNEEQIAQELSINPVRAKIIKRSVFSISESTIRKTLEDLYNLDLQIKSGLVDRFYAFELFLINFKAE